MHEFYKSEIEHCDPLVRQIQDLLLKADNRYLNTKQAADYSGFSERQLRKIINKGDCLGYKPGKEILIFKGDLDLYIKSHPVKRSILKRLRKSQHIKSNNVYDVAETM